MATITFIDASGDRSQVDAPGSIFDVEVNVPAMHEAVKAELAAARAGTHSTKTRAEVRGGGRKPWRQKGTGRARHGSIREPQWVGGGVAHGPRPRDYSMRINRKLRALALRSALTDRAKTGQVVVVDLPAFPEPETRRAVELLGRWGATGKTLLVLGHPGEQTNVWKSFRNLPNVLSAPRPTTYSVLAADTVVFTRQTFEALSGEGSVALPEAKAAAAVPAPRARAARAPAVRAASSPPAAPVTASSSPEAPTAPVSQAGGFFPEEPGATGAPAPGEPPATGLPPEAAEPPGADSADESDEPTQSPEGGG
jgi:large subunit ribosomal protein L4